MKTINQAGRGPMSPHERSTVLEAAFPHSPQRSIFSILGRKASRLLRRLGR